MTNEKTHGESGHPVAPIDVERVLRTLSLGGRIALARQRLGLTQQQLSERVGKSRATVVQYELGRLQPSLHQLEVIAQALEVAPELIAFGRQGITGLTQDTAHVTSLPEVELTADEERVVGGIGLSERLVDQLKISQGSARVYVLDRAAPAFGLSAGDRIVVNEQQELGELRRLYAFRTRQGVEVARLVPGLSMSGEGVKLNGSSGESHSYERGELNVIGLVVGAIVAA
jgi:transcriptional regulator with XRE-family HTH domain